MCLITIAFKQNSEYPLVVLANRDEFFERPSAPADYWTDIPEILAGRDLEKGGTWFGVNKSGLFAAVTNVYDKDTEHEGLQSRGWLVRDLLQNGSEIDGYFSDLSDRADKYAGFNLVAGNTDILVAMNNRQLDQVLLGSGYHGITNGPLHDTWPKVTRSCSLLKDVLGQGIPDDEEMFYSILNNRELLAGDNDEAAAGRYSSIFVSAGNYGTRCSTILLLTKSGKFRFYERIYDQTGTVVSNQSFITE